MKILLLLIMTYVLLQVKLTTSKFDFEDMEDCKIKQICAEKMIGLIRFGHSEAPF